MRHQNIIGVDVSESSIKVLELDAEHTVIAYGSSPLKEGIVKNGMIVNVEEFGNVLSEILKNTKPQTLYSKGGLLRAVLSLPESKLFTHYVDIPKEVKRGDMLDYVRDDAEKIVPFGLTEMYSDSHIVETAHGHSGTFVGVPKENLDNYVEAFTRAGVTPILIGGELFSLGNSLLPSDKLEEPYLILDMGAHTTTIGIFGHDAIAHVSVTIPIGGETLTDILAKEKNIGKEEAEKLKREYGMAPKHVRSHVADILEKYLSEIAGKTEEARVYFEEKSRRRITHLILSGGTALMPGIKEFFAKHIAIEITIADPLPKVKSTDVFETGMPALFFANVIGLALCGTDTKKAGINLLTQYRYSSDDTEKETLNIADVRSFGDAKYVIYYALKRIWRIVSGAEQKIILTAEKHKVRVNGKLILTALLLVFALGFLTWIMMSYL